MKTNLQLLWKILASLKSSLVPVEFYICGGNLQEVFIDNLLVLYKEKHNYNPKRNYSFGSFFSINIWLGWNNKFMSEFDF